MTEHEHGEVVPPKVFSRGLPEPSVTEVFNPHGHTTIDGAPIVQGMKVWDYNLRISIVTEDAYWGRCTGNPEAVRDGLAHCDGDHWFNCTGGYFNASRMWAYHPSTGQAAKDMP